MAARLLVIVLFLVGLLAAGLGVPLALSYAQARQLAMFTDRLTDTIFYASVAERPITQADTTGLAAELERYDEVYGVAVMVLDEDGRLVATSRQPPPVLDADAQERVKLALANRRSEVYPLLLPWDERPLVLAEPVLVDTEVRGVAVTISPPTPCAPRSCGCGRSWWRRGSPRWRWALSSRCRSSGGSCARCAASTRAPAGSRRPCSPGPTPSRSPTAPGRRNCGSCRSPSTA